ncbi:hypothetical protein BB560_001831 [Smittium megazygosporum]|uniref:Uncharacterized protein n=1 Tax=Smittium megazygosporum TaxID=133381 RepID=A0A2T9ZGG6_9FUNG|nr:hypothetical protein BB560_001831 [Smittium megazygosporum]
MNIQTTFSNNPSLSSAASPQYSRSRTNPLFSSSPEPEVCSIDPSSSLYKWSNPNLDHSDLVCPLKPFSQMIVSFNSSIYNEELTKLILHTKKLLSLDHQSFSSQDFRESSSSYFNVYSSIQRLNLQTLLDSRIQFLSEGLSRKLNHLNKKRRIYREKLSSILTFETKKYPFSTSKWGVWNRNQPPSGKVDYHRFCLDLVELYNSHGTSAQNFFSLGLVRTAKFTDAQGKDMIVALCAHPFTSHDSTNWWDWFINNNRNRPAAYSQPDPLNAGLFSIHVAEVTILHRVSCVGLHCLLPSSISSIWLSPNQSRKLYTTYEFNRSDWNLSVNQYELNSQKNFIGFLISRHGIIEMAYPLSPSEVHVDDTPNPKSIPNIIALSGMLGESIFSYIHPEDTVRLVNALQIAWDEKLDVYHYYDRMYNHPDSISDIEQQINTRKRNEIMWRKDGIRVHNSIVELFVQLRIIPTESVRDGGVDEHMWRPFDWNDPKNLEVHSKFVKMQLCKWPAVVTPPKSRFHNFSRFFDDPNQNTLNKLGTHNESHVEDNGFILISVKLLEEKTFDDHSSSSSLSASKYKPSNSTFLGRLTPTLNPKNLNDTNFADSLSRLERSLSSLSVSNNKSNLNTSYESLRIVSDEFIEEEYNSDNSGPPGSFYLNSPVISNSTSNRTSAYFPVDFLCEESGVYKLPVRKTPISTSNPIEDTPESKLSSDIPESLLNEKSSQEPISINDASFPSSPSNFKSPRNSNSSGSNNFSDLISDKTMCLENASPISFDPNLSPSGSFFKSTTLDPSSISLGDSQRGSPQSDYKDRIFKSDADLSISSSSSNFRNRPAPRYHKGFFPRQRRIGPIRSAILVQAQLGAMKNHSVPRN